MTGPERKYLIRKQGCYYRPNERGYTTSAIQAGRYTRDEAEKITHPNGKDGPRDGMSVIHEDELLGIDEDWTDYSALLADRRDPAVLAALPEVQALIAAAYEAAAQTVATQGDSSATEALGQRICCSGHMCGCQGATVEDWLLHLIRALTPDDATAALAARDAAMIARGMREAAGIAWALEDGDRWTRAAAQNAILARAAEIEGDAK